VFPPIQSLLKSILGQLPPISNYDFNAFLRYADQIIAAPIRLSNGTLTLADANTYTGATTITILAGATLNASAPGTFTLSGGQTLSSGIAKDSLDFHPVEAGLAGRRIVKYLGGVVAGNIIPEGSPTGVRQIIFVFNLVIEPGLRWE
jgi:hypothetical protein